MTNIPRMRFPGFSDEWQVKKLGDLATKVGSGATPTGGSSVYRPSGVPFIRSQNITGGKLNMRDVVFIDEETHRIMRNSAIRPNDVLLNITGASLGRTCVVPEGFKEGNLNQHVCIIRLAEANPYIVHTILSKPKGQHDLLKTQTGGGKEGLNFQAVRSFKLALPTQKEQEKIAEFLTAVDERIALMEKKLELLKKFKKGVMQKIFTQQIRFKDENGDLYPDWEEKRLGDIVTFTKGASISKGDISKEGKYEAIRYGELYTRYGEVIDEVESRTDLPSKSLIFSKANDVIIPSSGETHIDIATAACVLRDGVALSGDINILRPDCDGVFLAYYLNSQRSKVARLAQGVSVVHLYSSNLKSLALLLPMRPEQQKIASFLIAVDDRIKLENKKLQSAKEFKKSLLQRMFV